MIFFLILFLSFPKTVFEAKMEIGLVSQNMMGFVFPMHDSQLTCCCTQHETSVGMTVWLSQLLFFQV